MTVNNFFISVDDHVQEHPEVWTQRLSRSKWGDRIPHLAKNSDGVERWVVDGREIPLAGVADCGAAMPDRTVNPQCWADVPTSIYDPKERFESDGCGGNRLRRALSDSGGLGGQNFGRIEDAELELACVQTYNDWLLEEWASVSERFIPQCHYAAVSDRRRGNGNSSRREERP